MLCNVILGAYEMAHVNSCVCSALMLLSSLFIGTMYMLCNLLKLTPKHLFKGYATPLGRVRLLGVWEAVYRLVAG